MYNVILFVAATLLVRQDTNLCFPWWFGLIHVCVLPAVVNRPTHDKEVPLHKQHMYAT